MVGLYNLTLFGSPFVSTEQVYLGKATAFAGFSYPILGGLGLDLFSPARGLFLYCPLLVIGVVGLYYMLRQSAHHREGLLFLLCFLGILVPYSMWYDPVGGAGFGQRFLVPAIPFLLLPAGFVLERGPSRWRGLAYPLYLVGVIINGVAGLTSTIAPLHGYFDFQFLGPVLPTFLSGRLDVWWIGMVGQSYWIVSALLVAVAAMSPFLVSRITSRREESKLSREMAGETLQASSS